MRDFIYFNNDDVDFCFWQKKVQWDLICVYKNFYSLYSDDDDDECCDLSVVKKI